MPKVLVCPKCGYENKPSNLQCSSCRTSFYPTLECPKCGERTPPELGECILCGHKFIILKGEVDREDDEKVHALMQEAFKGMPELLVEKKEGKPQPVQKRGVAPVQKIPPIRTRKPPIPSLKAKPIQVRRLETRKRKGLSNGFRFVLKHPTRIAAERHLKIKFIVVIVIVFVLISAVFMIFELMRTEKVKIDGSFGDWQDVRKFDFSSGGKSWVDVVSGASLRNQDGFYLYLKLAGSIPTGRKVLFVAFIDADGKASTGYSIQGIGADTRIDVQSDVRDGSVSAFRGSDQMAFNWTSVSSVDSAFSDREAELKLVSGEIKDDYRVVFATVDDQSDHDIANYPISSSAAVLTLEKTQLADLLPGAETDVMELSATSHGGDSVLQNLELDYTPALKVVGPTTPIDVGPTTVTLKIKADASQLPSGTFAYIKVKSASGSVPAYVYGEDLKAYAKAPPADIRIDGAFDDWNKVTLNKQGVNPNVRDGLDVTSTGMSNETAGMALLLGVRDHVFLGTSVPIGVSVQGGGGGGPPAPVPKGEDAAILSLNFDNGAQELRVDVRGKYGIIYETSLYKLVSNKWEKQSTPIGAGSNRTMLETMVPSSYVSGFKNVKIYYQIFGWNDLGEGLLFIGNFRGTPLPTPDAVPKFMYIPIASDTSPGSFKISWVNDQPVNATVEYCQYSVSVCDSTNFPGSPSSAWDTMEFLTNGTALVEVGGLSSGTQYFYRAKARNAGSEIAYSPASSPYPSATTKTSTSAGMNPPFIIQPFHDVDNNYAYNSPPDVDQSYFLVYLNHTGAETLVSRGNPKPVVITASNLRNNDATGDPHQLAQNDPITFFIAGLYDDGGGIKYWVNTTASITVPWVDQPIWINIRTEKIPEIKMESLLPAGIALGMAVVITSVKIGRRR